MLTEYEPPPRHLCENIQRARARVRSGLGNGKGQAAKQMDGCRVVFLSPSILVLTEGLEGMPNPG